MNAVPCTIAGWPEMLLFLHILCTKLEALTFVFKVQVHLEALTYANRACEFLTVDGFTLIYLFSHKYFFANTVPEMKRWSPSQAVVTYGCCVTHNTRNSQIRLTDYLNHIVLFQLRVKS